MPVRVTIREPKPEEINRSATAVAAAAALPSPRNVSKLSSSNRPRPPFGSVSSSVRHLSHRDITASPRLAGYTFCFVAYLVQVISMVQYMIYSPVFEDLYDMHYSEEFALSPFYKYQNYGSAVSGGVLTVLCFFVILAHFDNLVCPAFWTKVFRDGSIFERNLIWVMFVLCVICVYLTTSSTSVGQIHPNAFFSSWIGLIAMTYNYDVWRVSADFESLRTSILDHPRITTVFWVLLLFFSILSAATILELFVKAELSSIQGDERKIPDAFWIPGLSTFWSSAIVSLLGTVLSFANINNFVWYKIWRYTEGILFFALFILYVYLTDEYTTPYSFFGLISNAYFGIWGCFLSSLSGFGTWIRVVSHGLKEAFEDEYEQNG